LFARGPTGTMARSIMKRAIEWNLLTLRIMLRAGKDRDLVGSASVDYLMYSGYVMMGYFWALQAEKATKLLLNGKGKRIRGFLSRQDSDRRPSTLTASCRGPTPTAAAHWRRRTR
jgi:hypothetical protein